MKPHQNEPATKKRASKYFSTYKMITNWSSCPLSQLQSELLSIYIHFIVRLLVYSLRCAVCSHPHRIAFRVLITPYLAFLTFFLLLLLLLLPGIKKEPFIAAAE